MPRVSTERKPPIEPRRGVTYETILARLDAQGRPYDRDFLDRVYRFTLEKHADQTRRSGEPYVSHPVYVAFLLADLKFDPICVAIGLLHDVLEDTLATKEALREEFGPEVAELVDGVTKIGRQQYVRRDDAQAESFRKMILASARDLRVILVKLADRLHNMMTLEHLSPESQRRIARETLEIYSPIAMRLGMSKVQGDLEDLAFFHRYPLQFAELHDKIKQKMRAGRGALQKIRDQLEKTLAEAGIPADISFRVKRYYSIYRKLLRQGIDISQLYDFQAFRIITESLRDTYAALGVVHQSWRPIPGRFKDYIAMPKPNLYQSLHTTVVGHDGQPFEVQIRTREMDLIAEEGVAAHWTYKEGNAEAPRNDPNILWLRQLLEWQKEIQEPREFLHALKIDLYPEEVYVFTPKGDVQSFPRGATPLDFAYRIHTDLGHQCSGARINGRLVPLKTPLQNGDMVEILTTPGRTPSRDWLGVAATSRARQKIRHWLNTEQKREAEGIGRRILERELRRLKQSPRRTLDGTKMQALLQQEGLTRVEEVYQRLGYGKLALSQVIAALVDADQLTAAPETRSGPLRRAVDRLLPFGSGPVLVRGEGDLLTYLAKCCNPVPGEELLGFVTRGRGIAVHSVDCPNVKNLGFDPDRLIEVQWGRPGETVYPVPLVIKTEDQPGMLARLTEVIAKEASNIRVFEAEAIETGLGLIDVVVEVKNRKHLDRLRQAIGKVAGVLAVARGSLERGSGDRAR